MKLLSQIAALTAFNLRTVGERRGSCLAAVFGIAGVVAVMVGVLSIDQGFRRTMEAAGSDDTAIVLRAGADTEMTSALTREDARLVAEAEAVARRGDTALASPELFVIIDLPKRGAGTAANVPVRGVEPPAFQVWDEVEVVEGRMFEWGRQEIIVGRGAASEFTGTGIGSKIELGQGMWEVVGIFAADGGIAESEIWADAAVLQPAYRRGSTYQAVHVKLDSPGRFAAFKDALTTDPRLNVKVVRESDYYADQSSMLSGLITGLGALIAILMGLGAVFGAINTMYTAVASRTREIATLRALGFTGTPVVASVLLESMLLAAVGGIVGALAAYAAFDGFRAATLNWRSFSQVAFAFQVTPALLTRGVVYALALGFVGGLSPAVRAARRPVAVALREG